jgi:hypothetical protein
VKEAQQMMKAKVAMLLAEKKAFKIKCKIEKR